MLIGADGLVDPLAVLKLLSGLGFVAATAVVLLVLARKAPPLTTQHNQLTGMTEHGIATWAAWFYGVFTGLPWLIVVVAEHPPLLVVVAVVLIGGIYRLVTLRNRRLFATRRLFAAPPMLVEPEQTPMPSPAPPSTYASTYNPDPDATRYLTPFPTYGTPELTYPPQESPWQRPANGTPIL